VLEFPLINSFYIAGTSLSHSLAGKQLAWQQQLRAESQNNTERKPQELGLFSAREVVSCTVLTPTANCVSSFVALLAPSLLHFLFSSALYSGFPLFPILLSSVLFLFRCVSSNLHTYIISSLPFNLLCLFPLPYLFLVTVSMYKIFPIE